MDRLELPPRRVQEPLEFSLLIDPFDTRKRERKNEAIGCKLSRKRKGKCSRDVRGCKEKWFKAHSHSERGYRREGWNVGKECRHAINSVRANILAATTPNPGTAMSAKKTSPTFLPTFSIIT
jgi:hypothetical protein